MKNIPLIIGPFPPPIGGVSVHIERLISSFNRLDYEYKFLDTSRLNYRHFINNFFKFKVIHLHTSNVFFQFLISIFSFFLNKKLIVTFHGDINRYGWSKKNLVYLNIFLCKYPILLNEKNLDRAIKINSNAKLISSFIPPVISDIDFDDDILKIKLKSFEKVFCTNAFNISYDKNGEEIYQIFTLFEVFKTFPSYLLIISDPSGEYEFQIKQKYDMIPPNIHIIPYPHEFYKIIVKSDCLIRFTTTDGDSLSVREGLYFNKIVIATDVIDRPEGVHLVKLNRAELINLIKKLKPNESLIQFPNNTVEKLIELYS